MPLFYHIFFKLLAYYCEIEDEIVVRHSKRQIALWILVQDARSHLLFPPLVSGKLLILGLLLC